MSVLSVKPIIQSDEPVDLGDDLALFAQPALSCSVAPPSIRKTASRARVRCNLRCVIHCSTTSDGIDRSKFAASMTRYGESSVECERTIEVQPATGLSHYGFGLLRLRFIRSGLH